MSCRRFVAPEQLELMLTNRCNLRCGYCHFFDSANEVVRELSTREWLALLDEAGRNRVFRVILSGGEALIREDFEQIVAGIISNRMRFSLLTNGILLDDARAAFLVSTNRCNHVQVSLDGIGEVHDRLRGQGSFVRAVAGIRTARRHGLTVTCRISLNRHNLASLPETIAYAREELDVHSVSTNWAVGFPGNGKDPADFQLDLRAVIESLSMHKQLAGEFGSFIASESAPLVALRHFSDFFHRVKSGDRLSGVSAVPVCPAPCSRLSVRADGAYIPCPYLPEQIAGWVGKNTLEDVWNNSPVLEAMRSRHLGDIAEYPRCRDCEFAPFCRISCPALEAESREQCFANCWCYKKCVELLPDFDFERMEYRR